MEESKHEEVRDDDDADGSAYAARLHDSHDSHDSHKLQVREPMFSHQSDALEKVRDNSCEAYARHLRELRFRYGDAFVDDMTTEELDHTWKIQKGEMKKGDMDMDVVKGLVKKRRDSPYGWHGRFDAEHEMEILQSGMGMWNDMPNYEPYGGKKKFFAWVARMGASIKLDILDCFGLRPKHIATTKRSEWMKATMEECIKQGIRPLPLEFFYYVWETRAKQAEQLPKRTLTKKHKVRAPKPVVNTYSTRFAVVDAGSVDLIPVAQAAALDT